MIDNRQQLTVTKALVETLVNGGERLQRPILTCRGQKKQICSDPTCEQSKKRNTQEMQQSF